jgi:hypothetical protein
LCPFAPELEGPFAVYSAPNGGNAMLDIGAVIVFAWCVVVYLIVQVIAYMLIF